MKISKYRVTLFLVPFILIFVFFSSSQKPWQGNLVSAQWSQELLYPVQFLFFKVRSTGHYFFNRYVFLSETEKQNIILRKKLYELESRMLDYQKKSEELSRLRDLLAYQKNFSMKTFPARVISSYNRNLIQTLRIDKGYQHGIRAGMPVVSPLGAVGKILRTGLYHSDVHLLTDGSFYLDVVIDRLRIRGITQGGGSERLQIRLHRRSDIKIGDLIFTSGLMGSFPRRIPVGEVSSISYDAEDVSQLVTVRPKIASSSIEDILVLSILDEQIETIAESIGNKILFSSPSSLK